MALGEWVSVTSSRELAQREIRIESSELAEDPEGEGDELKLIYEAKGLSSSEAEAMVRQLLADRSTALDALVRRELGIEPSELGGSAWEAAVSSFLLFSVGAIVPILPFLVTRGNAAVVSSVAVSAFALFAGIGAAITLFYGHAGLAIGRTAASPRTLSCRSHLRPREADRDRDHRMTTRLPAPPLMPALLSVAPRAGRS